MAVLATLSAVVAPLALRGAHAHIELTPTLVNRYVSLEARGERLHVQLSLLWGEVPALEERRRMDGDGNGQLDSAEIGRARRTFARRAHELLTMQLDGRPARWTPTAVISTSGKDTVSTTPMLLELTAVMELPGATSKLDVSLGPDFPRMGESEIVLQLARDWTLTGSELPTGQRSSRPEPRFKFATARTADDQSRQVTFLVRHHPGEAKRDGRAVVLGGLVVLVVLVALALAGWRLWQRQRSEEAGPPA